MFVITTSFINYFYFLRFMTNETHEKIIKVLEIKGPSLPINISKELGISSLFVSAFLSELANEKRIKVSNLKVGGSPLYFLDGQEKKLEEFHKYLHPKEAEAFLLLKDKKILKDSEQEPAIRVALRSIKDFAIGFKKNDEVYWRYILISENDVREILEPKIKREKIQIKTKPLKVVKEEFENPLVIKEEKTKKIKPKSEFVLKVIDFINKKGLKVIEEKDYKTKEYTCITEIKSELGNINFYTQAKDKKTISESDLKKLLSDAQKIPLSAFILYTGEMSKKTKEYLIKYSSVLKAKKL